MARRLYAAWMLGCCLSSSGCEVIADFDPKKLDTDRTLGPVPVQSLDGAIAVIPDASMQDGALIRPVEPDAGESADAAVSDAALHGGLDARVERDAAPLYDLDASGLERL